MQLLKSLLVPLSIPRTNLWFSQLWKKNSERLPRTTLPFLLHCCLPADNVWVSRTAVGRKGNWGFSRWQCQRHSGHFSGGPGRVQYLIPTVATWIMNSPSYWFLLLLSHLLHRIPLLKTISIIKYMTLSPVPVYSFLVLCISFLMVWFILKRYAFNGRMNPGPCIHAILLSYLRPDLL